MKPHKLIAIVAASQNGVIGRQNTLPWRLRTDLQRFKQLTMGHWLIMGRKTFESIGKALPGRQTVVLSRANGPTLPNVHFVSSLDQALSLVPDNKEAFVVGGAEIYRLSKDRITDIYMTRVLANIEGDARLEEWDWNEFECRTQLELPADEHNEWPTAFEHWVRKQDVKVEAPANEGLG